MTTKILFIQGAGKDAHDQWDIKLVESLRSELGENYDVVFPHMPNEAQPKFAAWNNVLQKAFATLVDGDFLVGHSVGATMLLHALETRPPDFRPGALILLAPPFIGPDGWTSDELNPRLS